MEKSCTALLAIAKHIENCSFYKSSLSPLTDAIKYSRADTSRNSGEAAEGFKFFSFVVIFDEIYLLSDFVFKVNCSIKDYLSNDQDCIEN